MQEPLGRLTFCKDLGASYKGTRRLPSLKVWGFIEAVKVPEAPHFPPPRSVGAFLCLWAFSNLLTV